MSFVCPLPPIKVYVRAEYLYDHQRGHGEFVEGVWCSVKSIRGEAYRFETYLPQYGALYDKLPISAFAWKKELTEDIPLDMLQIWDCLGYHVEVIEKPLLTGLRADVYCKDKVCAAACMFSRSTARNLTPGYRTSRLRKRQTSTRATTLSGWTTDSTRCSRITGACSTTHP